MLVSLDGFRWDYLDRGLTPNLSRLAREGVRAEAMVPVFPTKTFPNHYSIVTGRYPAHHGIVGNRFTAPDIGGRFRLDIARQCGTAASTWLSRSGSPRSDRGNPPLPYSGREGRRAINGVRPTHTRSLRRATCPIPPGYAGCSNGSTCRRSAVRPS